MVFLLGFFGGTFDPVFNSCGCGDDSQSTALLTNNMPLDHDDDTIVRMASSSGSYSSSSHSAEYLTANEEDEDDDADDETSSSDTSSIMTGPRLPDHWDEHHFHTNHMIDNGCFSVDFEEDDDDVRATIVLSYTYPTCNRHSRLLHRTFRQTRQQSTTEPIDTLKSDDELESDNDYRETDDEDSKSCHDSYGTTLHEALFEEADEDSDKEDNVAEGEEVTINEAGQFLLFSDVKDDEAEGEEITVDEADRVLLFNDSRETVTEGEGKEVTIDDAERVLLGDVSKEDEEGDEYEAEGEEITFDEAERILLGNESEESECLVNYSDCYEVGSGQHLKATACYTDEEKTKSHSKKPLGDDQRDFDCVSVDPRQHQCNILEQHLPTHLESMISEVQALSHVMSEAPQFECLENFHDDRISPSPTRSLFMASSEAAFIEHGNVYTANTEASPKESLEDSAENDDETQFVSHESESAHFLVDEQETLFVNRLNSAEAAVPDNTKPAAEELHQEIHPGCIGLQLSEIDSEEVDTVTMNLNQTCEAELESIPDDCQTTIEINSDDTVVPNDSTPVAENEVIIQSDQHLEIRLTDLQLSEIETNTSEDSRTEDDQTHASVDTAMYIDQLLSISHAASAESIWVKFEWNYQDGEQTDNGTSTDHCRPTEISVACATSGEDALSFMSTDDIDDGHVVTSLPGSDLLCDTNHWLLDQVSWDIDAGLERSLRGDPLNELDRSIKGISSGPTDGVDQCMMAPLCSYSCHIDRIGDGANKDAGLSPDSLGEMDPSPVQQSVTKPTMMSDCLESTPDHDILALSSAVDQQPINKSSKEDLVRAPTEICDVTCRATTERTVHTKIKKECVCKQSETDKALFGSVQFDESLMTPPRYPSKLLKSIDAAILNAETLLVNINQAKVDLCVAETDAGYPPDRSQCALGEHEKFSVTNHQSHEPFASPAQLLVKECKNVYKTRDLCVEGDDTVMACSDSASPSRGRRYSYPSDESSENDRQNDHESFNGQFFFQLEEEIIFQEADTQDPDDGETASSIDSLAGYDDSSTALFHWVTEAIEPMPEIY